MDPQYDSLNQKTSFYYPLLLLPAQKRRAMEALYRFCWAADEIADSPAPLAEKKQKLVQFKKALRDCFKGKARTPLFRNLCETIRFFQMTPQPLFRILQGQEQDLRPVRFKTFHELKAYSLKVAGGPGLASMEIFGFKDAPHRDYAENLGVFLQIVNIMRDFREDMGLGRQYLPAEDFMRFHLNPAHITEGHSHWKPFVEFQLLRAWDFLDQSRKSLSLKQRSKLVTAEAIAAVYLKLHQKLRNYPDRILKSRVSLSKADKMLSVMGTVGRCFLWKMK